MMPAMPGLHCGKKNKSSLKKSVPQSNIYLPKKLQIPIFSDNSAGNRLYFCIYRIRTPFDVQTAFCIAVHKNVCYTHIPIEKVGRCYYGHQRNNRIHLYLLFMLVIGGILLHPEQERG
jgi:hypothetical protein